MENKMAKERSNNFSQEELNKLRELIEQFPHILNKKTDCTSSKLKDKAWSQLTNEFNSNNLIYRTKKQLINKFNNMKKIARKELSNEKKERRCTGGGPPPPKPSNTSQWICGVMGESIVGLPSTHDSDFAHESTEDETDQTVALVHIVEEIPLLDNSENGIPSIVTNTEDWKSNVSDTPIISVEENQEVQFDTSTPFSMLRKPVSTPLEQGNRKRKLFTPLETRKKIVKMITEKEKFVEKKGIREVKLLQFAEEEHTMNMKHKEELHDIEVDFQKKMNELRIQKISLEIRIEQEKLKKYMSDSDNGVE